MHTTRDRSFAGIHAEPIAILLERYNGVEAEAQQALDPYGTFSPSVSGGGKWFSLPASTLCTLLQTARRATLDVVATLKSTALLSPHISLAGLNPPLWTLGHIAFFYDDAFLSVLRRASPSDGDAAKAASKCLPGPAWRFFDSMRITHAERWEMHAARLRLNATPVAANCKTRALESPALPSEKSVLTYLVRTAVEVEMHLTGTNNATRCVGRVTTPVETFLFLYALTHELWHLEDLLCTMNVLRCPLPQSLARSGPEAAAGNATAATETFADDVIVPGGWFALGASRTVSGSGASPFVFDSEKWAHPIRLEPFRISRFCVTNGEFLEFVLAGGYDRGSDAPLAECWSHEGRRWLESQRPPIQAPGGWRREAPHGAAAAARRWTIEHFGRCVEVTSAEAVDLPVVRVSWYEACAYCAWRGRRLPSEAEWEAAACGAPQPHADAARLASEKRTFPWGESPPSPQQANFSFIFDDALPCASVREGEESHTGRAASPTTSGSRGFDECDSNVRATRARPRFLGPRFRGGMLPVTSLPAGDSAFGCRQMLGNCWEWTSSTLYPFPGYAVDFPYREQSAPWFGSTRVARGGSWASSNLLTTCRSEYRSFYHPSARRETFVGFRTCALTVNEDG
jgi:iron(II)-dependent oxidoreductase